MTKSGLKLFCMTTRTTVVVAALALAGCDAQHDLGETAETSGTDSGGETSTGKITASGVDTDTSGPSGGVSGNPTATGPGTGQVSSTGQAPTTTVAESSDGGEVTGFPPAEDCDPSETIVEWLYDPGALLDQSGANANFSGQGTCNFSIGDVSGPDDYQIVELVLQCVLNGNSDNDSFVNEPFDFFTSVATNLEPQALFAAVSSTVDARIVIDSDFDVGTSGWVVLLNPALDADPYPSLALTSGAGLVPPSVDFGPWYGEIEANVSGAQCGFDVDECGGETVGLEVGWAGSRPFSVHEGEHGGFGSPVEETVYDVFPTRLRMVEETQCLDNPLRVFEFVIVAMQP